MSLSAYEPWFRLGSFATVLALMLLWETLAPRRATLEPRLRHLARNLALTAIDTLVVRLVVPLLPVGLASLAATRGWGVLNLVAWPAWLEVVLAIVVFDFVIYVQHVLFHAIPLLWRLHMVHHSDLDFDTSTGVRFHPIEILLSLGLKSALVLVLGPAPLAVLIFEVLLNATALFSHSNIRLPAKLDRTLRLLLVTPDMHRVHHSVQIAESNSNFGFNLAIWDRLCGTYTAQPAAGHEGMALGLEEHRDVHRLRLGRLLALPFVNRSRHYAIGGTAAVTTGDDHQRQTDSVS